MISKLEQSELQQEREELEAHFAYSCASVVKTKDASPRWSVENRFPFQ